MDNRRRLRIRRAEWGGPSHLTAAMIGLVFIIWFGQVVPTTLYSNCGYAAYWVAGWFSFSSLFQWTAAAVTAMILLWLVSFLDREGLNAWGERLAQGAILFVLAFWLFAVKSFLFPFAPPQLAQMTAIAGAIFPHDIVLVEELSPLNRPDDPDRPNVEFEFHPLSYGAINKKTREIFTSEFSPTEADLQRLQSCVAEQQRALAQWERDQETLEDYAHEIERSEKPSRPRDWREDNAP